MKKLIVIIILGYLANFVDAYGWERIKYEYKGHSLHYVIDETTKTAATRSPGTDKYGNLVSWGYKGKIEIPSKIKFANEEYTVECISSKTFYYCSDLTEIIIPPTVKKIESYAFQYCYHLTSVVIPNGVSIIEEGVFLGCNQLKSVSIPPTVKKIESYAFQNCNHLTSVAIPNGVSIIEERVFQGCNQLKSVIIPESVTKIEKLAFYCCTNLTSIHIPDAVYEIGIKAFGGCTNLRDVNFPSSLTTIAPGTFYFCSNLQNIEIPNTVISIGSNAFGECGALTSVSIPESISSIDKYAFERSYYIKDVYYGAWHPITCDSQIFENSVYSEATLHIPSLAIANYMKTEPWKNFKKFKIHYFAGMDENSVFDDPIDQKCAVFNLNGMYVSDSLENLAPGLYIIRENGKIQKIVVK
ncbi:MAG: leucine-rich repeat domain-containing protein [Muribaculaceae bacterium]|nr:leucine-rich repeat domain-containing protein [Muribaculaceae bacterium]